jgi:hypothetical protein
VSKQQQHAPTFPAAFFRFADQPSLLFRVVGTFLAGGFIPCVTGHTLDGKRRTNARIADVVPVQAVQS